MSQRIFYDLTVEPEPAPPAHPQIEVLSDPLEEIRPAIEELQNFMVSMSLRMGGNNYGRRN